VWRPSWVTRPAQKRRCSSDWKRSFRPTLTVGAPPSAPTPLLVRVHRFGTESLRQGRFSPRGREWAGAPFCPHPLCPPLPRGGRGGTRGSPLPRSGRGAGGEGEKSASVPHAANPSAVPLSATPLSRPAGADKGTTVRCGILGAGAPFCPHPLCPPLPRGGRGGTRGSPLPRSGRGAGGEGEKSASVPHAANPSAVPLSATPLSRPAGADKGTTVRCGILGAGAPFCPHPLCPPLPRGGRGGLWSAEARLQRRRKLRFRTPKDCVRLTPLPLAQWERGWG
jgi:hypothetical protein